MLNVRDFGAIGDGIADDTAAIQAAYDTLPSLGGAIFVPATPARYRTTAPINLSATKGLIFRGEGNASYIAGNFAGYVLDRNADVITDNGPIIIERLQVENGHADGGAIRMSGVINSAVRDCRIKGFRGVIGEANTFTFRISNVRATVTNGGVPVGSIGIYASNHTLIESCDVVGFDNGIRLGGGGNHVVGCRIEVNRTGILAGRDLADQDMQWGGSFIRGTSFEGNDTGIYLFHAGACTIENVGIQGSTGGTPGGVSQCGLKCHAMYTVAVRGLGTNGVFQVAGISFSDYPPTQVAFSEVLATNGIGPAWLNVPPGIDFRNCNQP